MTEELSPRARAILEAAERVVSGGAPTPPPPAMPAPPAASTSASAAQLAALAENVRLAVEAIRARLDELTARVDGLASQLQQQPTAPSPPRPEPMAADPDDAPRLLAIELAVGGATRADVDAALRERFGVTSTADLLDQVFGVGSSPNAHLPWGGPALG